jgi:hypothetical protein
MNQLGSDHSQFRILCSFIEWCPEENFTVYERPGRVIPFHHSFLSLRRTFINALCIINKATNMGILSAPTKSTTPSDFPVIQYVDDTLIIMKASQRELFCLKGILHSFSILTGLKINFHKSCLLPINLDVTKTIQLAAVFGCQVGTFPFTYLGLPMGLTRPKVKDYLPLITKVERRLNAIGSWLSIAERLTLVNSTFSVMPIFACAPLRYQ